MTTTEILALAAHHLETTTKPMKSSAKLCLDDARKSAAAGHDDLQVRVLALRSLDYSIGMLHADHARVKKAVRG